MAREQAARMQESLAGSDVLVEVDLTDTKVLAMVAYLLRLGTDFGRLPAVTESEPAVASGTAGVDQLLEVRSRHR